MEEKKENKEKNLKVSVNNTEKTTTQRKYSYEELTDICTELSRQNQNLIMKLNEASALIMDKRLGYLFTIVGLSDKINDAELVTTCLAEIKEALFGQEKKDEPEAEKV